MWQTYPIAAVTDNNWLHECLCEMIKSIHEKITANLSVPDWPEIIPEPHREKLKSRTGLRDRLKKYQDKLQTLSQNDRDRVLNAFEQQNKIEDLLSCRCDCCEINALPQAINKEIKELFEFAFDLLKDLGTRDKHYEVIYQSLSERACPFCRIDSLSSPKSPREDYDHYIVKSIYPFAAANLLNLAPACKKCNQTYKTTKNILKKDDGSRRSSFFPYFAPYTQPELSLKRSQPFGVIDARKPDWEIEFNPSTQETETWNEVFDIKRRYIDDVLDPEYEKWLECFFKWSKAKHKIQAGTVDEIKSAIFDFIDDVKLIGISGKDFLKPLVFEMIYEHCSNNNTRLIKFLKDYTIAA
jgi:hypothetical protein